VGKKFQIVLGCDGERERGREGEREREREREMVLSLHDIVDLYI